MVTIKEWVQKYISIFASARAILITVTLKSRVFQLHESCPKFIFISLSSKLGFMYGHDNQTFKIVVYRERQTCFLFTLFTKHTKICLRQHWEQATFAFESKTSFLPAERENKFITGLLQESI